MFGDAAGFYFARPESEQWNVDASFIEFPLETAVRPGWIESFGMMVGFMMNVSASIHTKKSY